MGILPHFRRPDHCDLSRPDVLLTRGGIGSMLGSPSPNGFAFATQSTSSVHTGAGVSGPQIGSAIEMP